MSLKKLQKDYYNICNEYIDAFIKKQSISFDGWVGNEVGGIASFACEYFFNLSDIILDINSKQPKGLILEWQNNVVDFNMFSENPQYINYKSYTMGLRYDQLNKSHE